MFLLVRHRLFVFRQKRSVFLVFQVNEKETFLFNWKITNSLSRNLKWVIIKSEYRYKKIASRSRKTKKKLNLLLTVAVSSSKIQYWRINVKVSIMSSFFRFSFAQHERLTLFNPSTSWNKYENIRFECSPR